MTTLDRDYTAAMKVGASARKHLRFLDGKIANADSLDEIVRRWKVSICGTLPGIDERAVGLVLNAVAHELLEMVMARAVAEGHALSDDNPGITMPVIEVAAVLGRVGESLLLNTEMPGYEPTFANRGALDEVYATVRAEADLEKAKGEHTDAYRAAVDHYLDAADRLMEMIGEDGTPKPGADFGDVLTLTLEQSEALLDMARNDTTAEPAEREAMVEEFTAEVQDAKAKCAAYVIMRALDQVAAEPEAEAERPGVYRTGPLPPEIL